MKNKLFCTIMAVIMAAGLAFSNVGISYASSVTKDETVYIKTNGDGVKTSVTVSDQILNVKDSKDITDISSLLNIENVKGDEEFTQSGSNLTWKNDGSDIICYQGTTEEQLPVGMTISYELDGKPMTAKEMRNKSGHLKIIINYENYTSGGSYVPFLMVSGIVLDENVFSNVAIENGKLISDGDKEIALGFGLPGMSEYLGVSTLNVPEIFILEADVTDFENITCMSFATDEIFEDLSNEKIDSLDSLKAAMGKLSSAAMQLVNGSGALREGLDTLVASSEKLNEGAFTLANGGEALTNGMTSLNAGAQQLKDGADQLYAGTGILSASSQTLVSGTANLAQGSSNAKSGAAQLTGGMESVSNGIQNMCTGLTQTKSGTQSIKQLADSIAEAVPSTATDNVEISIHVKNDDIRSAVAKALQDKNIDDDIINTVLAVIEDKDITTNKDVTVGVDTFTLSTYIQQLQTTAAGVDTAVSNLQSGAAQLQGAAGQLQTGLTNLSTGLSTLESGANQVYAGSNALNAGIVKADNGANQLSQGALALCEGMFSLNAGANEFTNGFSTLTQGTSDLVTGVKLLDDGSIELSEGMIKFNEEGIQKLVSTFDGNLSGLFSKANTMIAHAKAYNNYSGISKDMNGSVKFIFVTESE